jgi:hypothetical protein
MIHAIPKRNPIKSKILNSNFKPTVNPKKTMVWLSKGRRYQGSRFGLGWDASWQGLGYSIRSNGQNGEDPPCSDTRDACGMRQQWEMERGS